MKWFSPLLVCAMVAAACSGDEPVASTTTDTITSVTTSTVAVRPPEPAVRLLFVGDVMLGRSVGPIAAQDPAGLFEDVRFVVSDADVAAFNLESPLTLRPHQSDNEYALEADPATAPLLAAAGFDVASVANNHTGDAGPASVVDTVETLSEAGVVAIGGGGDLAAAVAPFVVTVGQTRIGFLAFDATGYGLAAGTEPGAAPWDPVAGPASVRELAAVVDVVTVSIHSGAEYIPAADDATRAVAAALVDAGADIVWGHGPHVAQPVATYDRPGNDRAVVATSLGNFLFDQRFPGTEQGIILEVMAAEGSVVAYRIGDVSHQDRRVRFDGWRLPNSNAAYLEGAWWNTTADIAVDEPTPAEAPTGFVHDVISSAVGDATGDGEPDLVVAFRRPFEPNPVNQLQPDHPWQDSEGRSAHLGIYRLDGTPQWVAGTLFDPVDRFAVCDGSLAVGYGSFETEGIVATGVLAWEGFGLFTAPVLDGEGTPGCADVDRDGLLDPIVLR